MKQATQAMSLGRKTATRAQCDALVRFYVDSIESTLDDGARENAARAYRVLVEYLNTDRGRATSQRVREQMRELVMNSSLGRLSVSLEQMAVFHDFSEHCERWAVDRADNSLAGKGLPPQLASRMARSCSWKSH